MLKKCVTLGIVLLFLCSSIPSLAYSNDKTSSSLSDGNWLYVGGSGPGNYSSIQDALDNASDGDLIYVYDDSSPYYENLIIENSITLLGENRDTTIIHTKTDTVIWVKSDFVTIHGFTLLNSTSYCIYLSQIDSCWISGNYLSTVDKYHGKSIEIFDSTNITIFDNLFSGVIQLVSGSDITIMNNTINDVGIWAWANPTDELRNITIHSNIFNITIPNIGFDGEALSVQNCNKFFIYHNIIRSSLNNSFCSIWFSFVNDSLISGNIFLNWDWGIYMWQYCFNNSIDGNHFFDTCGIWLRLSGNSKVVNNNFNSSSLLKYIASNLLNKWDGNYWGRPRIFPKPVLIALWPFLPYMIQFDWNPAKEPYDIPGVM